MRLVLHPTLVRGLVVLGLFAGVVTGSASGSASSAEMTFRSSQVDQFAGSYVLMKDQSEDPKQAINQATHAMSFVLRPVARRQLRQRTVLYPSFAMQRQGENFRTSLTGDSSLLLPLSGSAVLWRAPFGEVVRAQLRPGPELVEVFDTQQGHCEHRLRLSPDHRTLTVEIRITSHELPQPIEYRLVYRKV